MSEPQEVTVNGKQATDVHIHVPRIGPWFYDVSLVDGPPPVGQRVELAIGDTFKASGTAAPRATGAFALSARARVVAGAGRWGDHVEATVYGDDAGVRASLVASDVAKAVGETLQSFTGGQPTLGAKYVRDAGTASKTLEDAARGAVWWVDWLGNTHVGARAGNTPSAKGVTLLEYDPLLGLATLAVDDLTQVSIGTTITDERLDAPITIAAFEISVKTGAIRVLAWCSVIEQSALVDALRGIIGRATDAKLFGKYKYRVVNLSVDRVNVQAVSKADGLPDVLAVPMAPGLAGCHAKLSLGAIVYLEFIAGDRADPEITGFCGRGVAGFVPQGLTIGSPDDSAALAARQGDPAEMLLPPMVLTGTITGFGPFTAVAEATTGKLLGAITGGSQHNVRIG